jgi:hypothetical protein
MMGELMSRAASRQALTMEEEVTFYDVSEISVRAVVCLPRHSGEKKSLTMACFKEKNLRQYEYSRL